MIYDRCAQYCMFFTVLILFVSVCLKIGCVTVSHHEYKINVELD